MKLIALSIALAVMGCKSESARKADHAAHDVREQRQALVQAKAEIETRRLARVTVLRAQHAVIASQPMLISAMAHNFALSDAGRADVNEKLTILQMRLDETKNLIEALSSADASIWQDRDATVRAEMDKLETARRDAWRALEHARPNAS